MVTRAIQKTTGKSVGPISTLYLDVCIKFAEIMPTDLPVVFCTLVNIIIKDVNVHG